MKKQNIRTLSLIVCTLTYLLIGAAILDFIESEEEVKQKEALEILEAQLTNKYNLSKTDFLIIEEVIMLWQPFKAGMPWKFAGSFYYATTVLTTIGYGHSTPKTDGGKLFTMVYAIIGIPLGLVMFNSIGERLNNLSSFLINKVRRALQTKQMETTEMDLILMASALSLLVLFIGAATFSHYEGWNYFNSIYYCFTTLTTIGFGDLVALQQDNALQTKPEYVTFALLFIMFGLAIIAASLNLMVLKFMMLNTEDEKRDEEKAIKAAAQTVHLDGDIILQVESDVRHWAREQVSTSRDELRSVCSCDIRCCFALQGSPKYTKNFITSSSSYASRNSMNCKFKADSLHDLRRTTICSLLRLPSPKSSSYYLSPSSTKEAFQLKSLSSKVDKPFLITSHSESFLLTESFILENNNSVTVIPKDKNIHYHKRVSL